jgi:predicted alpha/beta-fold hydrolase
MKIYQNSVQLIGLGSAGTNIVEAFLKNERTTELLKRDITRLSLLAIDIADPEIRALQESYVKFSEKMIKEGIPSERLRLIAQSVKFPTAEAMFDFINQKYNEYLVKEGAKLNFHPWLDSTMAIPPMAGGAGRRRALAKAIYALNYYQLGIIRNFINSFKEQALSSIITPTVIVIYGLGGGTGSGVFLEFTRHLRKVLGSGIPIIAFVIAPCSGDDPPAKGCSAFTAMNELSLVLNKEYNEYVTDTYGEFYRNPLNALVYLPLLPAYNKVGNIVEARREMDEMIVEMLYVLMDFDLADLLGGIGSEVGLTDNSVHTLGMVKVVYPLDKYISAFKIDYEKKQLLYELRKEKLDILERINKIIDGNNEETRKLYKNYLIKSGTYDEEKFEEKIKGIIYGNPRLEENLALHVKGIELQSKSWIKELMGYLTTIEMMGKIGPIEKAIIDLTLHKKGSRRRDNLESLLTNFTKTYLDFPESKASIFERLEQLIPSSQVFTVRQKKILEDFMNLSEVADKSLKILRFYDETRYFAEALIRYYEVLPDSKAELEELKKIKSELATLYLLVQLMLRTPFDEAKIIDEYHTYLNEIIERYIDKKGVVDCELLRIEESIKRKEFDRSKQQREVKKILSMKKYAREQLTNIERDIKRIQEEHAYVCYELEKVESIINLYDQLAKKIEVTSDYRKRLNKIVDLYNEYAQRITEITQPKNYYEKSAEITETEKIKIIFKILTEQEETLTENKIIKDILDMQHYKDYIKSLIRVFKTPSVMGFKPTYKSDYIWVTVEAPPKLWGEDLSQDLYTALAAYVTSEVSRTITVRVIESREPWVTRILVVGGRAKPEHLEAYDEMQLLYSKSNDFERHLSRSYLLEHGVSATQLINKIKNGYQPKKEVAAEKK